jgi:outer membrane protein W
MKLLKLTCITIGAALLALPAFAGTQKGQVELSLSGSGTWGVSGNGKDSKSVVGTLGLGYFFTDALELKGNVVGSWASAPGMDDVTTVTLLGGPDYHFNLKDSKLVPYVGVYGGALIYDTGHDSETTWLVDGHVGVKYFIGERTTLNLQVSYQEYFPDQGEDTGAVVFSLGVSYFF